MPRLSRLEFCILDVVVDGSEPFSMIYQDLASCGKPTWDMNLIAHGICNLMSLGMLELCETEIQDKSGFDSSGLLEHYEFLDKELQEVGVPFYYSKGEYFFQMTEAGKMEWQKVEYEPFYNR